MVFAIECLGHRRNRNGRGRIALNKETIEMRPDPRQRARCARKLTARTENPDPLLALLQRYAAELAAFDQPLGTEPVSDQEWDRIAEETWSHTQDGYS